MMRALSPKTTLSSASICNALLVVNGLALCLSDLRELLFSRVFTLRLSLRALCLVLEAARLIKLGGVAP